jgi:hypothetical protein
MKNAHTKNAEDVKAVVGPLLRAIQDTPTSKASVLSAKRLAQLSRRTERALGISGLHWREI